MHYRREHARAAAVGGDASTRPGRVRWQFGKIAGTRERRLRGVRLQVPRNDPCMVEPRRRVSVDPLPIEARDKLRSPGQFMDTLRAPTQTQLECNVRRRHFHLRKIKRSLVELSTRRRRRCDARERLDWPAPPLDADHACERRRDEHGLVDAIGWALRGEWRGYLHATATLRNPGRDSTAGTCDASDPADRCKGKVDDKIKITASPK